MINENISKVRENIVKACEKAGRNPEEVTLIAVSKTKPLSDIEEVIATTDTRDFGENKVQEMVDKYEKVSTPVNWHLIGQLQTNKVKYIVDKKKIQPEQTTIHILVNDINSAIISNIKILKLRNFFI